MANETIEGQWSGIGAQRSWPAMEPDAIDPHATFAA
jgi:hypothetical protein